MKKSQVKDNSPLTEVRNTYSDYITKVKQQISSIEDKYRKMMEEEAKELNESIQKYQKIVDGIDALLCLMNGDDPEKKEDDNPDELSFESENVDIEKDDDSDTDEVITKEPSSDDKQEEEPKIQDTLFPENNDENDEEPNENKGDVNTGDNVQTVEETPIQTENSGFVFGDDNNEEKETNDQGLNSEWPELPSDWQ